MKVTCQECQRNLNIPDDKVPKDQSFNITCPGCKNKIKVEDHLKPAQEETSLMEERTPILEERTPILEEDTPVLAEDGMDSSLVGGDSSADATLMFTDDEFDDDDEVEFYDENDKIALIFDPQNYETWSNVLIGMGYKLQRSKSPDHTVYKLKFNEYDVLIFNRESGEYELEENPLYRHLLSMPMVSRRKAFVVLVGDEFHTGDHMEAFAHSVNMVFNLKDVEQMEMLLKKFLKENETFYKIYKDTMQSVGKV